MKAPRVNDDVMQSGGSLARWINHDKPHWSMPVTGLLVSCQIFLWDDGENIISQVQFWILYNVNMCVKHFALFHTSKTLVEDN